MLLGVCPYSLRMWRAGLVWEERRTRAAQLKLRGLTALRVRAPGSTVATCDEQSALAFDAVASRAP